MARTGPGTSECTVGWTLWGEVGLGANALTKSYFDKAGLYSSMSTQEGVRHFLRELGQAQPAPYTVHMGQAEQAAVRRLLPGFLEQQRREPFYLGRIIQQSRDRLVTERVFSRDDDGYLAGHVVDGRPTLPGAFVTEIAVEAATGLRPDLFATAVTDLSFEHFLKLAERPGTKRIVAEVIRVGDDGVDVGVRVLEDVIAPTGQVLVRGRRHFSATVELRREPRPPARWRSWPEDGATPVPDPYHSGASPVVLSGEFHSTERTRVLPDGGRSAYTNPVPATHPVYRRFSVPVLLLDGLLRTGVLELLDGRYVPICAPVRIGRIELFEPVSDAALADREIELFAAREFSPSQGSGGSCRFVAADRSGQVVLQVLDLDWVQLGYLDTITDGHVHHPPVHPHPIGVAP
ncbi:MAG: hypothetical protein V9G19_06860 [Tetrasphaera sp.]